MNRQADPARGQPVAPGASPLAGGGGLSMAPSGAAALAAPGPVAGGLSPGAGLLQTGLGAAPLTGTAFALNRETRSGGVISIGWYPRRWSGGSPERSFNPDPRKTETMLDTPRSVYRNQVQCPPCPSPRRCLAAEFINQPSLSACLLVSIVQRGPKHEKRSNTMDHAAKVRKLSHSQRNTVAPA